jgi:hypothetical protein
MPLNFNLDPKPLLRFAHPDGLTLFADEASQVSILLSPGVSGEVKVTLLCLADEVAFRVNDQVRTEAEFTFHCGQADEHQLLQLTVIMVCSNPSDRDILIRFDAKAINQAGQHSPPIPQLPVTLKPRQRNGSPLAPSLPSETLAIEEPRQDPPSAETPEQDPPSASQDEPSAT